MRIAELSLRNYRVFEEVDLELPARVIGIFGVNGAGKSTLVESIRFALYGRARTKKDAIRTHGVLADCDVRVAFEHAGQHYEIRRALKGRSSTPEAELFVGGLQLAAGVTEVEAEVERLLRMDQQVFRASVFAEQKQLDAFSEVTPGKRKEMALRLLGIRPVDDARTAARREARSTKQSADQLAGAVADVAALEADLKVARDDAKEALGRAKAAAAELKTATARARAARKAFDVSNALRERVGRIGVERESVGREREQLAEERAERVARIERLTADLEAMPALERELAGLEGAGDRLRAAERLAEATSKLAQIRRQLEGLPAIEAGAALEDLRAAERAAREADKALADGEARLERDEERLGSAQDRLARSDEADPSQPCPTCGQQLGASFSSYVKHCREEVAAAKKAVAASGQAVRRTESDRKKANAALAAATKVGEAARVATERRSRLDEQVQALGGEVAQLAEPFGGELPELDGLRSGVARVRELGERIAALRVERERLAEAQADLTRVDGRLGELDARIEKIDAEAAKLAFDPEVHGRLDAERAEADCRLEEARDEERASADELGAVQQNVSRLEGQLEQARETERRVGELRDEARYLERVSILLDGFRDHLVARVGPELSREAEALFRELTNHEYDDLRIDQDTLAIEIADGDAYFPVERFSGSEADLANLALRVAISIHLSRVSGADVGMMVLDEVLGALDAERKDLLVQAMGRLASRFHQLFVITHAEQVKDQFPVTIEVRKTGRRRSEAFLLA